MPIGTWAVISVLLTKLSLRQAVVSPVMEWMSVTAGVAMNAVPVMVISTTPLFAPEEGLTLITDGAGGPFTVSVTSSLEPWPSGLNTWTACAPWSQRLTRSAAEMRK